MYTLIKVSQIMLTGFTYLQSQDYPGHIHSTVLQDYLDHLSEMGLNVS